MARERERERERYLVVALGAVDQRVPIGTKLEQENVRDRHGLGTLGRTDGARATQLLAHLTHGHGLLEVLEEHVGVQLVERSAGRSVLEIELGTLERVAPKVLGILHSTE